MVSVVIPTFNRAEDLKRALQSVIDQTYANWEVLVVDNNSKDSTDDAVNSLCDSRIKLLKIHNHGVIAVSRNLGIKHAQGNYIAFLDSDDWWTKNKLTESLRYLLDGADIIYHSLWITKKLGQKYFRPITTRQLKSPVFQDLLLNGNVLSNSSVVVKKEILEKAGPISEDSEFVAMEDYETWLKIAGITEKFKLIPEVLGYYWAGGGNTSNPQRTIDCLNNFEKHYSEKITQLNGNKDAWWINYAKTKNYFQMGAYRKILPLLKKLNLRQIISHIWENRKSYKHDPRH